MCADRPGVGAHRFDRTPQLALGAPELARPEDHLPFLRDVHAPVILGTRDFGGRCVEADLDPLVVRGCGPAGRKVAVAIVVHVATILPTAKAVRYRKVLDRAVGTFLPLRSVLNYGL